jgi:hypothetical protein
MICSEVSPFVSSRIRSTVDRKMKNGSLSPRYPAYGLAVVAIPPVYPRLERAL